MLLITGFWKLCGMGITFSDGTSSDRDVLVKVFFEGWIWVDFCLKNIIGGGLSTIGYSWVLRRVDMISRCWSVTS